MYVHQVNIIYAFPSILEALLETGLQMGTFSPKNQAVGRYLDAFDDNGSVRSLPSGFP
jgi:hypothetical protein